MSAAILTSEITFDSQVTSLLTLFSSLKIKCQILWVLLDPLEQAAGRSNAEENSQQTLVAMAIRCCLPRGPGSEVSLVRVAVGRC